MIVRSRLRLFRVSVLGFLLAGSAAWAQEGTKVVAVASGSTWRGVAELASFLTRRLPQKGIAVASPAVRRLRAEDPDYASFRNWGRKAVRAYKSGRYEQTVRYLSKAVAQLEILLRRYGPHPVLLQKFVRAHYYLGAARLKTADPEGARKAFVLAHYYDRTRKPSPRRFDPEVRAAFEKAVRKGSVQRGLISVRPSVPMRLFLDGRDVGVAPKTLQKVPFGRHLVTLFRLGYPVLSRFVDVDTREGAMWSPRVAPAPGQAELRRLLDQVDRELRRRRKPGPAIAKLARLLDTESLLLCRGSVDESEASWYDAGRKAFRKRVRRPNPVPESPAKEAILAALLRSRPVYDLGRGLVAACLTDADCPGGKCVAGKCIRERPFYKRWWFWVAVGAGVAAAAATGALVATLPERPILRLSSPP